MTSIVVTDIPQGVSFEEFRSELCAALTELNQKRLLHRADTALFQQVLVAEVALHPATGGRALVVECSDHDKRAPYYIRRIERYLTNIGAKRCRLPASNCYFVDAPAALVLKIEQG